MRKANTPVYKEFKILCGLIRPVSCPDLRNGIIIIIGKFFIKGIIFSKKRCNRLHRYNQFPWRPLVFYANDCRTRLH